MSKVVRCVIYARYSTDLQNANSVRDQINKCETFAASRGWLVIQRYDDRAMSGSIRQRPGYQQMLAGVEAGLVDVILAEALDRFTRDQAEAALLLQRCNFHDVEIHTLSEGHVSEIHVGMAGTMNALYLKELARKTRRGLEGRVKDGGSGGGKSYGYCVPVGAQGLPEVGRLELVPAEAAVVQRIFREYAAGRSPHAIASRLNEEGIPSPSGRHWKQNTINGNRLRGTGILNNELYIGVRVWNRLEYRKSPDTHKRVSRLRPVDQWLRVPVPDLRIVDDLLWAQAKARQGTAARRLAVATDPNMASAAQGLRRRRYLLSGLLRCGKCGGRMTVAGSGASRAFYCANAKEKGPAVCGGMPGLRLDRIEPVVMAGISRQLMTPEAIAKFRRAFAGKLAAMERELSSDREIVATALREVNREIKKLKALLMALAHKDLESSELLSSMVEAEARRKSLEAQRDAITGDLPSIPENLAELYRGKVIELVKTLSNPETVVSGACGPREFSLTA